MLKLNIVGLILFFCSCLFAQDYYFFNSPVGWNHEEQLLIENDNIIRNLKELVKISESKMKILFPHEILISENKNRQLICTDEYQFLYPENSFSIINNDIEIDLESNLVIFFVISSDSNLDDYNFVSNNEILFNSFKGETLYSPYKTSILSTELSYGEYARIFINIKKYVMMLNNVILNDTEKIRFNQGEIIGNSGRNTVSIQFFPRQMLEKKVIPVYVKLLPLQKS